MADLLKLRQLLPRMLRLLLLEQLGRSNFEIASPSSMLACYSTYDCQAYASSFCASNKVATL